ncbi:uncharacterized protein N7477_005155 [Penicillium maclennaniae]|uniref:uncharacterized protein n=1 Tax=Penicillium maclennaniae TaxID=1343394 RepID=UPI00253F80E6|nr:uncharacterized protein N7477_005155 [Penicillium maclennaniae]KAJ5675221.1 hypothetical protein N7477_005155 [Penicillium maclennaniae]
MAETIPVTARAGNMLKQEIFTESPTSTESGSAPSTPSSSAALEQTKFERVQVESAHFTPKQAPPSLESLPVEIKILILKEIPDWATLKSFLVLFQSFFPAYNLAKREVLCCILQTQFGPLLGEAIAAVRSCGLYLETHKEEAITLLDTWRRSDEIKKLDPNSSSRIDNPCDMEEIMNLFRLHEVLQFFLQDFVKTIPQPQWMELDEWTNSKFPIKLSSSEQYRFLRALCRLQTHANIIGRAEYPLDEPVCGSPFRNNWRDNETDGPFSPEEEAYRLFFGTIPPWECDEMGCVWTYLKTKVDPLYPEVRDSSSKLMKDHGLGDDAWFEELPLDAQPPYWGLLKSLTSLENLDASTGSLVAIGPNFVYRLLHATPLIRRDMVLSNADYMENTFIGDNSRVNIEPEDKLPLIYPADRYAVSGFEEMWSYSDLSPTQKPNIAWRMVSLLPHSPEDNLESVIIQDDEVGWDWYHALWDDDRLNEWGCLRLWTKREPWSLL